MMLPFSEKNNDILFLIKEIYIFPLDYDVHGIYLQNCGLRDGTQFPALLPISGIISILQTPTQVECA
jgi:hypothetical protein